MGDPPVGWKLPVGKSSFVYRVPPETPDTLIIVLFERNGDRTGLQSPFADIVRFISLVKKSQAAIRIIQGHVQPLEQRPEDSLSAEKIAAFYQRYLAAYKVFLKDGVPWFAGNLTTYVPPLKADREWLTREVTDQ